MVTETITLILYLSGSVAEHTPFEQISKCLKAKRTIERNVKGPTQKTYNGTMRLACKKFDVKISEHGSIVEFIDADPFKIN